MVLTIIYSSSHATPPFIYFTSATLVIFIIHHDLCAGCSPCLECSFPSSCRVSYISGPRINVISQVKMSLSISKFAFFISSTIIAASLCPIAACFLQLCYLFIGYFFSLVCIVLKSRKYVFLNTTHTISNA